MFEAECAPVTLASVVLTPTFGANATCADLCPTSEPTPTPEAEADSGGACSAAGRPLRGLLPLLVILVLLLPARRRRTWSGPPS